MFRKKLMRNYKWIMGVLIVLGVCLIVVSSMSLEGINNEYTSGLGVGLILAAAINLVVLWFRFRNSDYVAEMEIEMNDERVQMNKFKALAYSGVVAIVFLCVTSILNSYMNFNVALGNTITLGSYSVSMMFFKWFLRNR